MNDNRKDCSMTSPYAQMPEKLPDNISPEGWQCRHLIWELSRRDIGVSVPELGLGSPRCSESAIRRMLSLGQISRGWPGGRLRGRGVRYFASEQAAKEYFKDSGLQLRERQRQHYDHENVRSLISELAARPCGVGYEEITVSVYRARKEINRMVLDGELHRGNPGGTKFGKGMRFFTTREALEKYFGLVKARPLVDRRVIKPVVRGPAHLPGEAVFTAATVFTIALPPVRSLRTNTYAQG